jgi:hypothetical protein
VRVYVCSREVVCVCIRKGVWEVGKVKGIL